MVLAAAVEKARATLLPPPKPLIFAICCLPVAWLVWMGFSGGLGANPIEAITRFLGDWALRFMLIGLAVTPLRLLSGQNWLMRYRRMLGLFAFFYAVAHVLAYVGLDQFFDFSAIWADILKRNYITFGFAALLLLLPLAATSTNAMIKRLGGPRWRRLHQLVYPAAILAVTHHFLMVKADTREPVIHAAILAVLLGVRVADRFEKKRQRKERRRR